MRRTRASKLCALIVAGAASAVLAWGSAVHADTSVLVHAHNDHHKPLAALEYGAQSLEVDIWLVEGELRVGHDLVETRAGETLEKLYLQPLAQRSGESAVEVQLLVDVKSSAEPTYQVLQKTLEKYAEHLTRWEGEERVDGMVSVILSGNRAEAAWRGDLVSVDGRIGEMSEKDPRMVSADWKDHFTWSGSGTMPDREREELERLTREVQRTGAELRFWGTPETVAAWEVLQEVGVEYISTDEPERLASHLAE